MLAGLVGCAACAGGGGGTTTLDHVVRVTPDLRSAVVRVEVGGSAPRGLRLARPRTFVAMRDMVAQPGDRIIEREGPRLLLGDTGDIDAIEYAVDFHAFPKGRRTPRMDGDDAVAIDLDTVLLDADGARSSLVVNAPEGAATVSALHAGGADGARLAVPPEVTETAHWTAFTRRPVHEFDAAGVAVTVAPLEQVALSGEDLETWLRPAVETVVDAFGGPRSDRLLVMLRSAPGGGGPSFGEAFPGAHPTVVLHVGEVTGLDEVVGNWVAQHEIAHVALPRFAREDAWLSEGLASYYQELLIARAGGQSAERAWGRLLDGFARGAPRAGDDTLAGDSAKMGERHAYWRVYWSGAAIALEWDVALRRDHGRTLDEALAALCAAHPVDAPGGNDRLAAEDVLRELDAWLGGDLFTRTARAHLASRAFPDTSADLAWLGVVHEPPERARVDDAAPGTAARRAITAR